MTEMRFIREPIELEAAMKELIHTHGGGTDGDFSKLLQMVPSLGLLRLNENSPLNSRRRCSNSTSD